MGGFFAELRRRNVVRVALVYGVAAWALMQFADVMFPALKLPPWTVTLGAALLVLGLPIVLILAWAFELTPGASMNRDPPLSSGARFPSGPSNARDVSVSTRRAPPAPRRRGS